MEGRETRSKAKAGTSKIPYNPVTTSKRRRPIEARKLNKKQRTKEQNVSNLNLQEQNVEQNGEEHNVEEQHVAQISFHTSKKPHSLVTTSERSRRAKARKPNKNQRTVNELNVKEQNEEQNEEEQNAEEHNVEEQDTAHTSFDTSKKPRNLVTTSERSRRAKARKPNKNQRTVNELNVKEQNEGKNIEEQNEEQNAEHNVEVQHTAHTSFDKRPCNPVTKAERSICVKARKLDRKQRARERNVNELYVEKENVEQNIEEQKVEEHIVEEQHTAYISFASKRSRCVKARKLNRKQRTEEKNVEEENAEEENVEVNNVKEQRTCDDVGASSARHNIQTSCAAMPLSTEDTSIQHEQETISASIQHEQETISTSVQQEQKTNFVEVNQQVGAKKSIEFNRHGEAVGPNATHFKAQLGRFVKTLIPISYTAWKKVPKNYKDGVWNEIAKEFEVPSYMRMNVEQSMPSSFRGFKHSLRKYHLDKQPNLEARKLDIPTGIKKEDWEKFCIYESNEKQIKRRAQAVRSRMKSPYSHTGGRKSASMIEYEMIAKGNHSITRTDVWLATHIRKDGTVLPSAEPFVEKVKAKVDEFKRSGGSGSGHLLSIDDDPLAQVLGKKKCLPGVGSNVSKSKYEAALHPHVMYSEERTRRELLEKKLDKMEAQINFIVNNCTPQAARGPSTPMTTTLVVDDGSSASAAVKNPLLLEENSVPSKSADSTPNARMCELLDWNRKCVAVAKEVTDPIHKAICHDYQLKTEYEMKVSMCERKILNAKLYKETSDVKKIKDVGVGDFLVWPISHISFLGSEK